MRKLHGLAALLLMLWTPAVAGTDDTPVGAVTALYAAAKKATTTPVIQSKTVREALFTRGFRQVLASIDKREDGTGEAVLDFDPVLSTNADSKADHLAVKTLHETAEAATVLATFGTGQSRRSVAYDLRREDGGWRIDDIGSGPATKTDEAWSVRKISDSDLAARKAPEK